MARRRKKNPPLMMALVGGIVAIAGGVVLWQVFKPKVPKKAKTTSTKQSLVPKAKPSPSAKGGKYVGSGWTGWFHKDVFGNARDFAYVLGVLGYDIGNARLASWHPLSYEARNGVAHFQAEWNWVLRNRAPALGPILGMWGEPPKPLVVDGLLGPATIEPLYQVYQLQLREPGKWRQLLGG